MIGTNAAGTAALAIRQRRADRRRLDDNTIGGTAAGAGNTISGNLGDGVHITGGSSDNLVEGNLIGTNAAATAPWATGSMAC